jgi:hypothetical protein
MAHRGRWATGVIVTDGLLRLSLGGREGLGRNLRAPEQAWALVLVQPLVPFGDEERSGSCKETVSGEAGHYASQTRGGDSQRERDCASAGRVSLTWQLDDWQRYETRGRRSPMSRLAFLATSLRTSGTRMGSRLGVQVWARHIWCRRGPPGFS